MNTTQQELRAKTGNDYRKMRRAVRKQLRVGIKKSRVFRLLEIFKKKAA